MFKLKSVGVVVVLFSLITAGCSSATRQRMYENSVNRYENQYYNYSNGELCTVFLSFSSKSGYGDRVTASQRVMQQRGISRNDCYSLADDYQPRSSGSSNSRQPAYPTREPHKPWKASDWLKK